MVFLEYKEMLQLKFNQDEFIVSLCQKKFYNKSLKRMITVCK